MIFFSPKVLAIILSIVLCSSCSERNKVKRMMADFFETEIVIPDDLDCIYGQEVNKINLESIKGNKFIIYYDSLDCSSCRIGHLAENYPLYKMADTCDFSILTIFSPRIDDLDEVRLQLMLANSPVPIYVDANGSFRMKNSHVPSDFRFHNFFVAPDNSPVFVGNPLVSDKMYELFRHVLEQENNINY